MTLLNKIRHWLRRGPQVETSPVTPTRGRIDHVVIIDGSMSSLQAGRETNAGLLYKLLCEVAPSRHLSLRYEAGIQWHSWRASRDIIEGRGINRQIRRVYGFVASRYRPGDRIFLFGYSRGAYAVRSLAGVIDRVGLLHAEHATVRNIRQVYRQYESGGGNAAFRQRYCHANVEIEMIGVWDTVKSLGLRVPFFWRWTLAPHRFHNDQLGSHIRHGFQALALDETRQAYAPVMWTTSPDLPAVVEQMWFRGAHGDVGGQLGGLDAARPLSNIPLVWMLEKAAECDLPLPADWQTRFACDPAAPSVGTMRGWGKLFISRRKRRVGTDPSEAIHASVPSGKPTSGAWLHKYPAGSDGPDAEQAAGDARPEASLKP